MTKFIAKWLIASQVFPLIILIWGTFGLPHSVFLQNLTLLFWPSSIFLMALGATEHPFVEVAKVWSMSMGANAILYGVIGLLIYAIFIKGTEPRNDPKQQT